MKKLSIQGHDLNLFNLDDTKVGYLGVMGGNGRTRRLNGVRHSKLIKGVSLIIKQT